MCIRDRWWRVPAASRDHNSRNTSPKHSFKVVSMFLSISHKYMLRTKLLTQRGPPFFPSIERLKTWKMRKSRIKNIENSQIFQIPQFCSILGVFQGNLRQLGGVFGLSRGVLQASWVVLEASWRLLGGSKRRLEVSWRRLGASWGHLERVLGKMSKKCRGGSVFWKGFASQNGDKNH